MKDTTKTTAHQALPQSFRALRVDQDSTGTRSASFVTLPISALPEGDVTIQIEYSSLNFKDGMAVAGRPGILKRHPMTPGIDLAGRVIEDKSGTFDAGRQVLVTGWGIGERHDGGYAQLARVPAAWITELPGGVDCAWAMSIGTAGFTAMLAVMALEEHAVRPGDGEVLVTGAAGGVGSLAVTILSRSGFQVIASTGRAHEAEYLRRLGAGQVISREDVSQSTRPMESERWAGVIDTVGGATLAGAYAATRTHGSVAVCGLAGSPRLEATVYPMILRGVNLLGIDSVMCPSEKRQAAWRRLARDVPPELTAGFSDTQPLSEITALAGKILSGHIRGRTVIDVNR